MHKDPRVEQWAEFLAFVHWDNLDELAEIIVAEINGEME